MDKNMEVQKCKNVSRQLYKDLPISFEPRYSLNSRIIYNGKIV